ncbi:MAG: helix-turn-helix transcriptional regulator [Bdellovibrionales bacterium]|nr:helix-turn-helix transcriptional regulator [Bdellovibrionales bacterium]
MKSQVMHLIEMNMEHILKIFNLLGVCEKSPDGKVIFQNKKCLEICGDRKSRICEDGCMVEYKKIKKASLFNKGFFYIKNISFAFHESPTKKIADAILINLDNKLITLLYDRKEDLEKQTLELSSFDLSKAEKKIISMVLEGLTNAQIADKLCISRHTVKTHLNNIYKKIPPELKRLLLFTKVH